MRAPNLLFRIRIPRKSNDEIDETYCFPLMYLTLFIFHWKISLFFFFCALIEHFRLCGYGMHLHKRTASTCSVFKCNNGCEYDENIVENWYINIWLGFRKCFVQWYFSQVKKFPVHSIHVFHIVSLYKLSSNDIKCFDLLNFSVQIKPDARVPWGGGGSNFGQAPQEIPLNNANDTTANTKVDGFHLVNLTDAMANMTSFNVFIKSHIIDSRRCAGNETSFTYKGTSIYLFIHTCFVDFT